MYYITGFGFVREGWKEWFRLVINEYWEINNHHHLPKGFVRTGGNPYSLESYYWVWYLAPFVRAYQDVRCWWYGLAVRLYYAGHLKSKSGDRIPWHWFTKISLKKIR